MNTEWGETLQATLQMKEEEPHVLRGKEVATKREESGEAGKYYYLPKHDLFIPAVPGALSVYSSYLAALGDWVSPALTSLPTVQAKHLSLFAGHKVLQVERTVEVCRVLTESEKRARKRNQVEYKKSVSGLKRAIKKEGRVLEVL